MSIDPRPARGKNAPENQPDAHPASQPGPKPKSRVAGVDAYRGLVMFLMLAGILHLADVAQEFPNDPVWQFLGYHQSHVEWTGCSLHDLIHPSFTFLVGVSLPFSLAGRIRHGQSVWRMTGHAAWRALVLIWLGIFLRSIGHEHTIYTFIDTLTQIGLGYLPLFFIGLAIYHPGALRGAEPNSRRAAIRAALPWIALAVILVGYWAAFALYPLPTADFDYEAVDVPRDWPYHFSGFAAHWNKNSNIGWAFDRWFLNLFPRSDVFMANPGGYSTLNFIPHLGTMILGLIAGRWLQGLAVETAKSTPAQRLRLFTSHSDAIGNAAAAARRLAAPPKSASAVLARMVIVGVLCLAAAMALDAAGICPIVKRLWTPSWVLFAGGWAFLFLAAFYLIVDIWNWRAWTFPLLVIGMNSIVAYCMAELLLDRFIVDSFHTHFGPRAFQALGSAYEPLLSGLAVLAVYWLILFWMYRRRIIVKI
jgi:predicted acyltransferase